MDILHSHSEWISHYGGPAFFPLMFINGVGMPLIPADALLFAGAVLADKGEINLAAMLLASFSGSLLGSMTGYFIGRWGGAKLVGRIIALFHIDPRKFAKFQVLVRDKGLYFVIIARFLPVAREINGLLSGSLGMGFGRYMIGNCIGAFLWVLVWGALPYFFGHIF